MKFDADATVLEPEVMPPNGEAKTAETTGPWGVNPILAGFILDLANYNLAGTSGFIAGSAIGLWACVYNRIPPLITILIAFSCGSYCFTPLRGPIPLATLVGIIIVMWRKWGR